MILAPAGSNAVLTGQSLQCTDARAGRPMKEWEKFFPIVKDERSNGFVPCLVEVAIDEKKMLYPSSLVGVRVERQGIIDVSLHSPLIPLVFPLIVVLSFGI